MNNRRAQEYIWENMPLSEAERYLEKGAHRKRSKFFAAMLLDYDFQSIYEVGVNSGRNLDYILRYSPDKIVGGIDINKDAIALAKENLPDAHLECGSIYNLDIDKKYDIVFTSGLLLHIFPEDVKNVIYNCIKKSNKYVMHMETQGQDIIINGPKELKPTNKVSRKLRCVHNYARIYSELGCDAAVETSLYPESDAQHFIIVKTG